jgi:hypothetical protein
MDGDPEDFFVEDLEDVRDAFLSGVELLERGFEVSLDEAKEDMPRFLYWSTVEEVMEDAGYDRRLPPENVPLALGRLPGVEEPAFIMNPEFVGEDQPDFDVEPELSPEVDHNLLYPTVAGQAMDWAYRYQRGNSRKLAPGMQPHYTDQTVQHFLTHVGQIYTGQDWGFDFGEPEAEPVNPQGEQLGDLGQYDLTPSDIKRLIDDPSTEGENMIRNSVTKYAGMNAAYNEFGTALTEDILKMDPNELRKELDLSRQEDKAIARLIEPV